MDKKSNIITLDGAKQTAREASTHQRSASVMGRRELEKAYISSKMAFKEFSQNMEPLIALMQSLAPDVLAFAQLLQHYVGPNREELEAASSDRQAVLLDACEKFSANELPEGVELDDAIFTVAGNLLYLMRESRSMAKGEQDKSAAEAQQTE